MTCCRIPGVETYTFYIHSPFWTGLYARFESPDLTIPYSRPAVGPGKCVPITKVGSFANCASIRRRVDSAAFDRNQPSCTNGAGHLAGVMDKVTRYSACFPFDAIRTLT